MIDAAAHGFALTADEQIALSAFGDAFVRTARPGLRQEHPSLGDLGPLPFVHVMGPVEVTAAGRRVSRSATYVHPGVSGGSTTGAGASARPWRLAGQGEIGPGATMAPVPPRGNRFIGTLGEAAQGGPVPAGHSRIPGSARLMARSRLTVDLDDPLVDASDLEALLSGWTAARPRASRSQTSRSQPSRAQARR